jgi:hypothetical protein
MSSTTSNNRDQETAAQFYQRLKPAGKRMILSIDGGGARGLITLHCLAKLEELTGQPSYEIFDFYAGTSTGSLIAAGLAMRMDAQALMNAYKRNIPKVFEESQTAPCTTRAVLDAVAWILGRARVIPTQELNKLKRYFELLLRNGGKYMYSHAKLKTICEEILSDKDGKQITLGELYRRSVEASDGQLTKRLLITIKDVQRAETLFVVNAGPGGDAFQSMPLADAVLASSVAPIFLQPFGVWVDGGVGSFSNPCYQATVEATEYFTGLLKPEEYRPKHDDLSYMHNNVIHFSFGTGTRPDNIRDKKRVQEMLFHEWLLYVISETLDEANEYQVLLTEARFSLGNNWYSAEVNYEKVDFRRYQLVLDPDLLTKSVSEGGLGMAALTDKDKELISGLEMNANRPEELEIMERVGRAWADAIGKDFACPHCPYVDAAAAYTPPASPPRRVQPPLKQYVESIYLPKPARV